MLSPCGRSLSIKITSPNHPILPDPVGIPDSAATAIEPEIVTRLDGIFSLLLRLVSVAFVLLEVALTVS